MSNIGTFDGVTFDGVNNGPGIAALWHYCRTAMHPRELFETHLDVIERAIHRVCLDARVTGADEEDFASVAKLALLANDGAILQKFEGRCSLSTYVTIVVRRLLVDQMRSEGRWYVSAEARRRGEVAMLLDRLLHRDHNTFAEASAIVIARYPDVPAAELKEIAAALPERAARPRLVPIDEQVEEQHAARESAEERVLARELSERSASVGQILGAALAAMTAQDRVVLRLRYAKGSSIADIARALRIEQRPLYRRIESLLDDLRRALQQAGIDAVSVTDLIGNAGNPLDFGWRADDGAGGAP